MVVVVVVVVVILKSVEPYHENVGSLLKCNNLMMRLGKWPYWEGHSCCSSLPFPFIFLFLFLSCLIPITKHRKLPTYFGFGASSENLGQYLNGGCLIPPPYFIFHYLTSFRRCHALTYASWHWHSPLPSPAPISP